MLLLGLTGRLRRDLRGVSLVRFMVTQNTARSGTKLAVSYD
jgi:hypothetical protein